jgi:hypothetical protein
MTERIHPESRQQLEQLIKLHGMQRILDTLREIAREQSGGTPSRGEPVNNHVIVAAREPEPDYDAMNRLVRPAGG